MFKRYIVKRAFTLVALLPALLMQGAFAAAVDDEDLIDPTQPLVLVADSGDGDEGGLFNFGFFDELLTSYELSSVLIRSSDRIAVINGERVRVGDKVGSAIVTGIEDDRVTLNVDGESETLELYENSIKTLVQGDE